MPNKVLNYTERGEGMPLVLIHGFPFDHTIWSRQLEEVGDSVRVLAPDLPGFGQSRALEGGEATMDDYADRLAQWAQEVGLGRFVLVGHSMGGYVAFAFLRRHADMIAGLGLVCTRSGPDSEQGKKGRYEMADNVRERGPQAVVDAMLPRLLSDETREKNPQIVAQLKEIMLRQSKEGIIAALQAMATRPNSSPLLETIEVPTLVVGGAGDQIIPAPEIDLMAATIPGARQERIDGAAHMPMMERPDKLSGMLRDLALGSRTVPNVPEPPDTDNIAKVRTHRG